MMGEVSGLIPCINSWGFHKPDSEHTVWSAEIMWPPLSTTHDFIIYKNIFGLLHINKYYLNIRIIRNKERVTFRMPPLSRIKGLLQELSFVNKYPVEAVSFCTCSRASSPPSPVGKKGDTSAANFFTYKAVCVWRISNGDVRLFNLFTVR